MSGSTRDRGVARALCSRLATVSIWIACGVLPVVGQTAEISQRVLPVAELTDLDFIRVFLEDQFIFPESPDYTSAVFLDITRDGFGANDVLILYPTGDTARLLEQTATTSHRSPRN